MRKATSNSQMLLRSVLSKGIGNEPQKKKNVKGLARLLQWALDTASATSLETITRPEAPKPPFLQPLVPYLEVTLNPKP